MMEHSSPDSGPHAIFWLGESVSPESLEALRHYPAKHAIRVPRLSDYRLIRLQSTPSSHPLHPQSVGLIHFDQSTAEGANWAVALLERHPRTYLIRVCKRLSDDTARQDTSRTLSEVKNHLIGLRFTENESGRLVQWPWFDANYFQAMYQSATELQRERLLGPIDSVSVFHDGNLHFIVKHSLSPDGTPAEIKPLGSESQSLLVHQSLNDFARDLAQFVEQYRSELSIKSSVQLQSLCSQAIPMALTQGFFSAEWIGIWVLIGLVQAGRDNGLPHVGGSLCKLLDMALKCGIDRRMLIALSHRFSAWEDVRQPWFSGSTQHSIWDLHAIAAIAIQNPELHFNSKGITSKVRWSDHVPMLDFQLMDDTGGTEVLFGANQVDSVLAQFLHRRRPGHSLLPAVHKVSLVPTRLHSNPLGHTNFKVLNLEKPLTLINCTSYGLHLSMQSWGHRRLSNTTHNLALQAQDPVEPPDGLVANYFLDDVRQAPKADSLKWRTCLSPRDKNPLWLDLKNVSSAWLEIFNQSDKPLHCDSSRSAIFECSEIYPALDVKAKWKFSECASMLRVQICLDWLWSEDFLHLSTWMSLEGVACCVRIQPTGTIQWHVHRELDIPIESLKPQAAVFQDLFRMPVHASLELNSLDQQHKIPLVQIQLLDRQCGEVQLGCEILYCEKSSNLKLRLIGRLSALNLKLQDSQLTLGQQNKTLLLLPETLLLAVEFNAHG